VVCPHINRINEGEAAIFKCLIHNPALWMWKLPQKFNNKYMDYGRILFIKRVSVNSAGEYYCYELNHLSVEERKGVGILEVNG